MRTYTLLMTFPAKITQDADGFSVEFIDFDAFSEGDSLAEALLNAQEALDVTLQGYIDTDQDIPDPSPKKGVLIHMIAASPEVAVALILKSF